MCRVALNNSLAMSLETWCQREPSLVIIFSGKTSSTSHRYGQKLLHDYLFEHPAYARCGGAHSSERLGFRRHGMTRAAPLRTSSEYDLLDFNIQ